MALTLTKKLISSHLVSGDMTPGTGDFHPKTLTQDSTGTMAYLQLEAMGFPASKPGSPWHISTTIRSSPALKTPTTINTSTPSVKTRGVPFRAGNGICHQVNLERFGKPGWTLLGSDSHTPTGGGIGMLAIGAGGLTLPWPWAAGRITSPCRRS